MDNPLGMRSPRDLEADDRSLHRQIIDTEQKIRAASRYPAELLSALRILEGARWDIYNELVHRGLRPADRIIDPPP